MENEIRKKIDEEFTPEQNKIMKLKIEKEYYYGKFLEAQDLANFYMAKSEALEKELEHLQAFKHKFIEELTNEN